MPSIFTHYLCGNAVIDLLGNQKQQLILQYRQSFNLGTQGPDIFFYYRVCPWGKSEKIPGIGEMMHEENVRSFFLASLDYIFTQKDRQKDLLAAYLCGYICHYILDFNTHPYIFYKTGFIRRGELPTSKYTCNHRNFETALDVLMLDKMIKEKPYSMNAPKLIKVSKEDIFSIAEMLESIFERVYSIKISSSRITTAIKNMVGVQSLLRSRTGLRKKCLCAVEKRFGLSPLISSMIHTPTITDGLDYLNTAEKPWFLPWDQSKQSTASFSQMFNISVQEAGTICTTLLDSLDNTEDIAYTLELIGNRSFYSGLDCTHKVEFKYYNSIFL